MTVITVGKDILNLEGMILYSVAVKVIRRRHPNQRSLFKSISELFGALNPPKKIPYPDGTIIAGYPSIAI